MANVPAVHVSLPAPARQRLPLGPNTDTYAPENGTYICHWVAAPVHALLLPVPPHG